MVNNDKTKEMSKVKVTWKGTSKAKPVSSKNALSALKENDRGEGMEIYHAHTL